MMQTAKSNIFAPFPGFEDEARLSAVLSKFKGKDSHFPVELINPEPGEDDEDDDFRGGKSHFEIKSNRKKQREEELRNFL